MCSPIGERVLMSYSCSKHAEQDTKNRPAKPDTTKGQHLQFAVGDANICPTAFRRNGGGCRGAAVSPPAKNPMPLWRHKRGD